jgi:hypothetical protein
VPGEWVGAPCGWAGVCMEGNGRRSGAVAATHKRCKRQIAAAMPPGSVYTYILLQLCNSLKRLLLILLQLVLEVLYISKVCRCIKAHNKHTGHNCGLLVLLNRPACTTWFWRGRQRLGLGASKWD